MNIGTYKPHRTISLMARITTDTTYVGYKNPYRYRGYRYDSETYLYYLQSRYYNPEFGRFINADGILGATGELLSHNMFIYCGNNPIMREDENGYLWNLIGGAVVGGVFIKRWWWSLLPSNVLEKFVLFIAVIRRNNYVCIYFYMVGFYFSMLFRRVQYGFSNYIS